ncbi:HAD family phosphatase [Novosphingobium sp.]|uniref:HAD family hydrolase n=1 Tax=Novosphingobium sp. TaxID=1874826 RepID=UPI0025EF9617|nr:HAD family phosphatase [Novosphingobium sp.]
MLTPSPSLPALGKIDAVVFDIGRVLVKWSIRDLYAKLIDDPARLDWFLAHVATEQWNFEHDAGKPLAQLVAERTALFPDEAELIAIYPQRWLETVPGPIPGTAALVEALAARGHPLYAITNFGAETWAMFRPTFPVLDHFRDIVVSGRERMVKPDPAIYALAQGRFGHDPARMLFIDDSLPNVLSARACGWNAHHFHDAETLETELLAWGLLD